MAACHSTPAVQSMQLQESTRIGFRTINMGVQNQKTTPQQQSAYQPQLLNWVYLTITEQNQPADQVITHVFVNMTIDHLIFYRDSHRARPLLILLWEIFNYLFHKLQNIIILSICFTSPNNIEYLYIF